MKIGDVYLPCVAGFDADVAKWGTETMYPLGTDLQVIAEFDPEPISAEILGTLIKLFSGTKTADEYTEDLEALASRKTVFNYVHEVQGLSGILVIEKCDVDPRKSTQVKRDFLFSGMFLPLAQYWDRIDSVPVILNNSYGITLDDCENWILSPGSLNLRLKVISRNWTLNTVPWFGLRNLCTFSLQLNRTGLERSEYTMVLQGSTLPDTRFWGS